MPLNNRGMQLIATALQDTLTHAQLHSGPGGADGTDNVTTSGRQEINWSTPDSLGNFGLTSLINFTDGEINGVVTSVTLWDAETDGDVYGEWVLAGDQTFGFDGQYQVTAIDFTGTTTP